MQQVSSTYPIGTQIQDRYVVEGLLGQGGFSAVYLVRSLDGQRFALKELRNRSKEERERFLFECELLQRLTHPALPEVSYVFEDGSGTYLLMEYIEGPDLEVLRRRQTQQRFALTEALSLLAPIIDAVAYLHRQTVPILHRDIKPANIIVREGNGKSILVDFGIAKEYYPDATTTAARHCSPGYGAPEQYSGMGTDQRADIYGLAATCYALLAGVVPVDALHRATALATKKVDPLVPVNERVPAIPASVARVLQRAMAIGAEQRFSTVEEFGQALNQASEIYSLDTFSRTTSTEQLSIGRGRNNSLLKQRRLQIPHLTRVRLLTILLSLFLILASIGLASGIFIATRYAPRSVATITHHTNAPSTTKRAAAGTYSVLAKHYSGTIHDLLTNTTGTMQLTHMQQNDAVISGDFAGLQRTNAFTGVLDSSKHLLFTVAGSDPLFFEGSVRSDGNLVGNFCRQDQAGQCVGNYGIWSVASRP